MGLGDRRDSESLKSVLNPRNYSPLSLHMCADTVRLEACNAVVERDNLTMQSQFATVANEAAADEAAEDLLKEIERENMSRQVKKKKQKTKRKGKEAQRLEQAPQRSPT